MIDPIERGFQKVALRSTSAESGAGLQAPSTTGTQPAILPQRDEWDGKDPMKYPFPIFGTQHGSAVYPPPNGVARLDEVKPGNGMVTGKITVNGHPYDFNSGGPGALSIPPGEKLVAGYRDRTNSPGMNVGSGKDRFGFSFNLLEPGTRSDTTADPRAPATNEHGAEERTYLRIHADGGKPGTSGCIGIVGDPTTQRRFVDDMKAELKRNPDFTLRVEGPVLPPAELKKRPGVDPLPTDRDG